MSEICEYVGVKWSAEFKLLGISFDQCLDKMDRNYSDCFDKVKKELSSWRHRCLTVFGKITVIKTMCIPKFTHIATVIPNLSIGQIKEIEREFQLFINNSNSFSISLIWPILRFGITVSMCVNFGIHIVLITVIFSNTVKNLCLHEFSSFLTLSKQSE